MIAHLNAGLVEDLLTGFSLLLIGGAVHFDGGFHGILAEFSATYSLQ